MTWGETIKRLTGTLLVLPCFIQISAQESISLEGEWKFRLDRMLQFPGSCCCQEIDGYS